MLFILQWGVSVRGIHCRSFSKGPINIEKSWDTSILVSPRIIMTPLACDLRVTANDWKENCTLKYIKTFFDAFFLFFAGGKRTLQSWNSIPCRICDQRNVLRRSRAVLLDCPGYLSKRNDLGILDTVQRIRCKVALNHPFSTFSFKHRH